MTKRIILAIVLSGAALAPLCAAALAADSRLATHQYNPDEIVRLEGKLNVQTTIAFGEDEKIENVAVGDSDSWQIMPNRRADLLFIKPLSQNARTNMTVVTDRHTYFFDLVASPAAKPVYALRFAYAGRKVEAPAVAAAAAPAVDLPPAMAPAPAISQPSSSPPPQPMFRVPAAPALGAASPAATAMPAAPPARAAVPAQSSSTQSSSVQSQPAISPAAERAAALRAEAQRKAAERAEARRIAAGQEQARKAEVRRVKAERDAARAEAGRLKAQRDAASRAEADRRKAERDASRRAEAEKIRADRAAARRAQADAAIARRAEAARLSAAAQAPLARRAATASVQPQAALQPATAQWKRSGSRALLPQRVQDNGQSTFVVWPAGRPIPQLLVADAQGGEVALPFTIEGETVIIAGVPGRIILRSGKASAVLERELPRPPRRAVAAPKPAATQPGR
jgi:type IV secretory pathway VirB9-like protein